MAALAEFWIEGAIFFALWSFAMYRIGIRVGRGGGDGRELSEPPVMSAAVSVNARADVEAALAGGDKIEAIKRMREATGMGLKEAKDAVEAMERR